VSLSYASSAGHALVDRELYLCEQSRTSWSSTRSQEAWTRGIAWAKRATAPRHAIHRQRRPTVTSTRGWYTTMTPWRPG